MKFKTKIYVAPMGSANAFELHADYLNKQGVEGWKLISVLPIISGNLKPTPTLVYFLQREDYEN